MYYATYKVFTTRPEIACFQTEKERDDWVNFEDDFSKSFPMLPEISLPRVKIVNRLLVRKLDSGEMYRRIDDEDVPSMYWLVRKDSVCNV